MTANKIRLMPVSMFRFLDDQHLIFNCCANIFNCISTLFSDSETTILPYYYCVELWIDLYWERVVSSFSIQLIGLIEVDPCYAKSQYRSIRIVPCHNRAICKTKWTSYNQLSFKMQKLYTNNISTIKQ